MPLTESSRTLVVLWIAAPATYLAMVAVGRWLKRRLGVRLGVTYQLFCVAVAFLVPLRFQPQHPDLLHMLESAVVILGTLVLLSMIQRLFWELYVQERRQTQIPKFISDVVALVLFAVALVLVLTFIYEVRIPGLLAGSGILAVILGLAMQDTLGNIIAGFSLHFGKPFRPGDWLILEARHAEVIEVNWRSTRLRTNDHIYLDIPNNQITKQTIVNLTYPTEPHAMRLSASIDHRIAPSVVKDLLHRAAAHALGVLQEPPPKVFLVSFENAAATYEVKFWMEDHSRFNDINDAIRTNIWYELQRHQIQFAFPMLALQIERPGAKERAPEVASLRAMLSQQPLFRALDDAERDLLLFQAKSYRFGRGEKLIEQGQTGDSMFLLVRGEAGVLVHHHDALTQVAVLRAGDCFGEMSLLTGEKRSATVLAQSDCQVVEIAKASLAEVLQAKPALLEQISALLARRQLETESLVAEGASRRNAAQAQREIAASFLSRLRAFFEL